MAARAGSVVVLGATAGTKGRCHLLVFYWLWRWRDGVVVVTLRSYCDLRGQRRLVEVTLFCLQHRHSGLVKDESEGNSASIDNHNPFLRQ